MKHAPVTSKQLGELMPIRLRFPSIFEANDFGELPLPQIEGDEAASARAQVLRTTDVLTAIYAYQQPANQAPQIVGEDEAPRLLFLPGQYRLLS